MVTPWIIAIYFVIGSLIWVAAGVYLGFEGVEENNRWLRASGLLVAVLGPFILRVWCEVVIVLFRINETLSDIRYSVEPDEG